MRDGCGGVISSRLPDPFTPQEIREMAERKERNKQSEAVRTAKRGAVGRKQAKGKQPEKLKSETSKSGRRLPAMGHGGMGVTGSKCQYCIDMGF
eukprot:3484654-Rhodomonas_salina.1